MTKKTDNFIVSNLFAGKVVRNSNNKKVIKWFSDNFVRYQIEQFSEGTNITAYISSKKPKRSLQQNNFYWHYLKLIEDETGNSSEDLHNYFKGKYLSKGITEVYGHKVRKVKSTTKLNKSEFAEYMMNIESESGVAIPSTEEFNPKFYQQ